MKREMSAFALVLAAVLLFAYLFNLNLTGFAVYQSDLSGGAYSGTFYNGSAIVLNSSANLTSGSYTSSVLNAGNKSLWNNLTWVGSVPNGSSLSFQVTTCSDSNCSGASFSNVTTNNNTIDLSPMNLTSQYLQYKVLFSRESINITSPSLVGVSYYYSTLKPSTSNNETSNQTNSTTETVLNTSASIIDPSGTLDSQRDISLNYIASGTNITCSYSILNTSGIVVDNTTLIGCGNLTFDLSSDGTYNLHLYVNGTGGFVQKSSKFIVDTSSNQNQQQTQQNTTQQQQVNTTQQQQQQKTIQTITALSASDISSGNFTPGESENLTFNVKNVGTAPVSSCILVFKGNYASWISAPKVNKNLSPGQTASFSFTVKVPLNVSDGSYLESASASCLETSVSKNFNINVEKPKLNATILNSRRTSLGNVKVSYSLSELSGQDQNVSISFDILNSNNTKIGNATDKQELQANSTKTFSLNIPINSTAEGNMSLLGEFDSKVYSSKISEPITLGAPISGFAILENMGTGSYAVVGIVVVVLLALFFGIRRAKKKSRKKPSANERNSVESEK